MMRVRFAIARRDELVQADSVRVEGGFVVFKTDGVAGGTCARYPLADVAYVDLDAAGHAQGTEGGS